MRVEYTNNYICFFINWTITVIALCTWLGFNDSEPNESDGEGPVNRVSSTDKAQKADGQSFQIKPNKQRAKKKKLSSCVLL